MRRSEFSAKLEKVHLSSPRRVKSTAQRRSRTFRHSGREKRGLSASRIFLFPPCTLVIETHRSSYPRTRGSRYLLQIGGSFAVSPYGTGGTLISRRRRLSSRGRRSCACVSIASGSNDDFTESKANNF